MTGTSFQSGATRTIEPSGYRLAHSPRRRQCPVFARSGHRQRRFRMIACAGARRSGAITLHDHRGQLDRRVDPYQGHAGHPDDIGRGEPMADETPARCRCNGRHRMTRYIVKVRLRERAAGERGPFYGIQNKWPRTIPVRTIIPITNIQPLMSRPWNISVYSMAVCTDPSWYGNGSCTVLSRTNRSCDKRVCS